MARIDTAVDAAYKAGFRGQDLITAVAIAGCESGWDPSNVGDNGTSFGLWQIHITAHPEYSASAMMDPIANGQAAFTLYTRAGNKFGDWTCYNTGGYLGSLPQSIIAVRKYQAGVIAGAGTPVDNTQQCLDACQAAGGGPIIVAICQAACYGGALAGTPNGSPAQQNQQAIEIPCSRCSIQDLPACFACLAAYLSKGLAAIGINLLLGIGVLIGVYVLFKPEIDDHVRQLADSAKRAAALAAEA